MLSVAMLANAEILAHAMMARSAGLSEDEWKLIYILIKRGFKYCILSGNDRPGIVLRSEKVLSEKEVTSALIPVDVLTRKHGVEYIQFINDANQLVLFLPRF
jgi:hypothetical protein